MDVLDPQRRIGRAPGWRLVFHAAEGEAVGEKLFAIDHTSHHADLTVAMEGGLKPGRFEATIWRLRTDDFETLVLESTGRSDADETTRVLLRSPVFVRVQLFWADVAGSDPSDAAAPPIATFRITRLARRSEGLELKTVIEGRLAVYERINAKKLPAGSAAEAISGGDPLTSSTNLLEAIGLQPDRDFIVHPSLAKEPPAEALPFQSGQPALEALALVRTQMIKRPPRRRGRSLFMIRDGVLHVGPYRPIPHDPKTGVIDLDAQNVVISVERTGEVSPIEPGESVVGEAPPTRTGYRLTCSGVANLRPGDVVRFTAEPESSDLLGGFGLPAALGAAGRSAVHVYVSSVSHRTGRRIGWQSILAGVEVDGNPFDGEACWDVVNTPATESAGEEERDPAADPADRLRSSIGARIHAALAARPVTNIGEVRGHTSRTEMDGARVHRAAHSSTILRGFDDQGGPGQARLDPIDRESADVRLNIPYLSPFAWGPFGHVLPRYPGTRVMLLNNRRNPHDAVDIGALWRTQDDSSFTAPAGAQFGDWWLVLPAFPGSAPAAVREGTAPVDVPADAKASHDLIDASGNRVIEVNGFRISAHMPDRMPAPDERPVPAPNDDEESSGILIEQYDAGSRIRILKDGTIEIEAGGDLTLKADNIRLVARAGGTVDASNE